MEFFEKLNRILFYIKRPNYNRWRKYGFSPERYEKLSAPWIQKLKIKTILDIGANTGQAAIPLLIAFPEAKVYSFEPLPDCYEELAKLSKSFNNLSTFNLALGDGIGEVSFERSSYSPSSSMLSMSDEHKRNFPSTEDTKTVKVNIERLDNITESLSIAGELMIKLDVQGFEKQVIEGGTKTFRRAKVVIIEMSFEKLYQNQPLFDDVYKLLFDCGLSYAGSFEQLFSPIDKRILQQDSIFVRV